MSSFLDIEFSLTASLSHVKIRVSWYLFGEIFCNLVNRPRAYGEGIESHLFEHCIPHCFGLIGVYHSRNHGIEEPGPQGDLRLQLF